MGELTPTDRTRLKRLPERGSHDRDTVYRILDEAPICHLGYLHEGRPVVIPTIHARSEDNLYIHGSAASRTLRTLRERVEVCVVATILDGVVLARSLFHSSMNYRSVVVYGTSREVTGEAEQDRAFEAVTNHLVPGRWEDARLPNEKERKATMVIAVSLDEASAKVRTGPPQDDEDDYLLPVWGGVLPLRLVREEPVPDARNFSEPPDYL